MNSRLTYAGLLLAALLLVFTPYAQAQTTVAEELETETIEQLGSDASQALMRVYDYDATIPLEARIVEKQERDGLAREKIVFRGVQGFLVPGYLQYPTEREAPSPCVLLLHGWSGSKESWWADNNYISGGNVRRGLLDAGYAILALDAQCHGDRIAQNDFAPVNHYRAEGENPRKGYFTQEEIYIQTTRDYRRALDFLETRSDIDAERIGMLGYSMGGTQTYLLTGVEPRVQVSVAVAAPAERSKFSPIAPQNFVRGIGERPFLTIMGTTDTMCPVPHARGRFSLIDNSISDQRFFDGGHRLSADWVPGAIAWVVEHL